MTYRREIDGLRAVSVLSVILFHADLHVFSGGFVGVDVFFVISGFLITTILLNEHRTGTFSLVNFYERRARRVLPALFVVALACLPFAWLWLVPSDLESFAQSLIAVSVFASNILFYRSTGYFSAGAEWQPLLHTWSLAVEEQYYLIFPLFLMLAWRFARRWLPWLLVAMAVASLTVARWRLIHDPAAAFYLLPSRGWEILIGALVAFQAATTTGLWARVRSSALAAQVGSALGLLAIGTAVFTFDRRTPYPSPYTLLPTVGAGLIIAFATPTTWVGRLLGWAPLVGVGLISYSAYLWHWPLFVFARHRAIPTIPGKLVMGALSGAALLAGFLSWKYVETPFRSRKRVSRRVIFTTAAVGAVALSAAGLFGHFMNGRSSRLVATAVPPDVEFLWLRSGGCMYQPHPPTGLSVGAQGTQCWLGDRTAGRKAIVLGDSYAGAYDAFWDIVGKQVGLNINSVTTNWCMPTRNDDWTGRGEIYQEQCRFDRRYFAENVAKFDVAILGGNWMDYLAIGRLAGVLDLIEFAASQAKLVVVMAAPTQWDVSPIEVYTRSLLEKRRFDITALPRSADALEKSANEFLESAVAKYSNVLFFDRDSLFTAAGVPSEVTDQNVPFSLEGNHLSKYGSKAAAIAFFRSRKYKQFAGLVRALGSASR